MTRLMANAGGVEEMAEQPLLSWLPSDGALLSKTRSVNVGDDTFAYRRFVYDAPEAPPLVCLQHFRGNLVCRLHHFAREMSTTVGIRPDWPDA